MCVNWKPVYTRLTYNGSLRTVEPFSHSTKTMKVWGWHRCDRKASQNCFYELLYNFPTLEQYSIKIVLVPSHIPESFVISVRHQRHTTPLVIFVQNLDLPIRNDWQLRTYCELSNINWYHWKPRPCPHPHTSLLVTYQLVLSSPLDSLLNRCAYTTSCISAMVHGERFEFIN